MRLVPLWITSFLDTYQPIPEMPEYFHEINSIKDFHFRTINSSEYEDCDLEFQLEEVVDQDKKKYKGSTFTITVYNAVAYNVLDRASLQLEDEKNYLSVNIHRYSESHFLDYIGKITNIHINTGSLKHYRFCSVYKVVDVYTYQVPTIEKVGFELYPCNDGTVRSLAIPKEKTWWEKMVETLN